MGKDAHGTDETEKSIRSTNKTAVALQSTTKPPTVWVMFDFDQIIDRRHTSSLKWERFGPDVLPMWVADMDFASPPAVQDALRGRVDHGVYGYTLAPPDTVAAICNRLQRLHNWTVEPDWLCFLPGLAPGLNLACRSFADDDEAVMTLSPIYPPFRSAPVYQERQRIDVALRDTENGWQFDLDDLEAAVTPSTRLFLFCNPHNPVGRAYAREEIEAVAAFCERHDLILCSDEIHCELLLDPVRHCPTASLGPEVAARTITLMAPSKTFNLPGLVGGYAIISNPERRRRFKAEMCGLFHGLNCLFYPACEAAFNEGDPWLTALLEYLRQNRDLVEAFVAKHLQPVRMQHVEATYLAWLDVRALALDDPVDAIAAAGVGLSDGRDFGAPGFVRLNFGCPRSVLQTALDRLRRCLHSLQAPG